ncbi:MAG: hypothetical protein WDW38_006847 [Sanguina aurantia]
MISPNLALPDPLTHTTPAWKPRAFIYHNLVTDSEARHLVALAAPQMRRSTVVGAGGKSVEDNYRTSYGTFLRRYQDAVVERVENRIAAWTHLPVSHQEDLQLLRYGVGQFYKVHSDTLRDDEAGIRVATVLLYLNEPQEGGETAFPTSDGNLSECARGHVAFRPKRGDALLFWSVWPNGVVDTHAAHTGCPVLGGVMWTATKWIHEKPFRPHELTSRRPGVYQTPSYEDPGLCEDTSSACETWAKNGDCEKNKEFMVSSASGLGPCRRSCLACTVCAPDDTQCYNENRINLGYLVFDSAELNVS